MYMSSESIIFFKNYEEKTKHFFTNYFNSKLIKFLFNIKVMLLV